MTVESYESCNHTHTTVTESDIVCINCGLSKVVTLFQQNGHNVSEKAVFSLLFSSSDLRKLLKRSSIDTYIPKFINCAIQEDSMTETARLDIEMEARRIIKESGKEKTGINPTNLAAASIWLVCRKMGFRVPQRAFKGVQAQSIRFVAKQIEKSVKGY